MRVKLPALFALVMLRVSAQTPATVPTPSDSDLREMWGSEAARVFAQYCPSYSAQQLFLDAASKTVSAIKTGLPVHLYRSENRGQKIKENFGIPIFEGNDSEMFGRPVVDGNYLIEDAKDAVLSWYASHGIYAVNSTKQKGTLARVASLSALQKSQASHPIPVPSAAELEQLWAAEAKSEKWLDTISTYRTLFLATADDTVSLMQSGQPFTLKRPSVSPVVAQTITTSNWVAHTDGFMTTFDHSYQVPYTPVDERLGLPIAETEDSQPIEAILKEDAKEAILAWYASRGIYPVNSTKRKKP